MKLPDSKSGAESRIENWAQRGKELRPVEWERMPEIYLYMDQVITYMQSMLSLFERSEETRLLTSSMINNYVKDGLLDRPEKKKYSRRHIAALMMICMLKQVLSIQDISALLKPLIEESNLHSVYKKFFDVQTTALQEVCAQVEETLPEGKDALRHLALTLAIEANAHRAAAERIICELQKERPGEELPKKENKK